MRFTCKPSDELPSETFDYNFGSDLAQAEGIHGKAEVMDNYIKGARVKVQGWIRTARLAGDSHDAVQEMLDTRLLSDTVQRTRRPPTKEELKAYLARYPELLEELQAEGE